QIDKASFLRSIPKQATPFMFVFAVDEAAAMLNLFTIDKVSIFRCFRHALVLLSRSMGDFGQVVGVVLSTHSSVANFSPPQHLD
ncbi:hypothetical protein, partial [Vibrio vulnificus]|uniref:hypothetical protein n=1 Tax=Vibrio vulnificus TaxID=672 RepID=UPI0019D44936